ncbi:porin [Pseudoduganella violaceinigra]|uniref:porin n=1 Tax=Pseudoduganella violaceinigra TaxID=246602 RepID=UPI0004214E24|nr:porin [Pseudoduganella violaceinigra]
MKKTLISMAILAASGAAYAQSNVSIYGTMDAGIVAERGGKNGNVTKVTSGVANASRIGFKGNEDLGNGLSAVFQLETGVKEDTGELDNTNNQLFNRQAFVGLSSKEAGTLTLGRQYTPWYNTFLQVGDPFQAGLSGSAKNLFPANGINVRNSNSIAYKTPLLNGVQAELFYALGEKKESSTGRQLGASIGYTNGPLAVRLAYNNINNDTVSAANVVQKNEIGHNTLLAVNYDFKVVKAYAMFGSNKGLNSSPLPAAAAYTATPVAASVDNRTFLLGANVPVSAAGSLIVSWAKVDDKSFDRDANQYAIGYLHSLSQRTTAYMSYGKIKNKNGASYTVGNNTEAGSGDAAYNVGIRHTF